MTKSSIIGSPEYSNSTMVKAMEKEIDKLPTPTPSLVMESNENSTSSLKEEKDAEQSDITELKESDFDSDQTKDIPEIAKEVEYTPPYSAFSKYQILFIFVVVVYIGFLGPVTGNLYIPALSLLQTEFHTSTTTINGTVAVFMGVFAVGPFLWAIHADFGGRKFLYASSLVIALVANILLAAVPKHIAALYVLRVFQAVGTSAVIPLGVGTVSDLISPKSRAKGVSYFMLGPNMGPILGPIIGGLILMNGNHWRWLFGFTSITTGIAVVVVAVFLPETLRCIVGNGDPRWREGEAFPTSTSSADPVPKVNMGILQNLGIQKPVSDTPLFKKLYPRPPKPTLKGYFSTFVEVRVLVCSMSTAILFSSYYSFSVILSHELHSRFGYNNLEIGACYVCPGIGLLCGSLSGGHLSDYVRSRSKNWIPENRLWFQIGGLLVSLAGCCGFGWAIEKKLHIVVILVFSFLLAFGMTWCSNATMTYLTELDRKRTATLVSISSFFRNAAAAVASAVIFKLIDKMGAGWCFTGLAFCDLATIAGIVYLMIAGRRRQVKMDLAKKTASE